MSKSKFKTQTIDQIMHKAIMEQIEKEEYETRQRQLEDEQRRFEYQRQLEHDRLEYNRQISGLVNPIEYLDKVVRDAKITSTIRSVGDKKEITISILLG